MPDSMNDEHTAEAGRVNDGRDRYQESEINDGINSINSRDAESWPSANTSTSPQMTRMEIQKGERNTMLKK